MPWLTLVIVAPLAGLPVLALWRSLTDEAARWVALVVHARGVRRLGRHAGELRDGRGGSAVGLEAPLGRVGRSLVVRGRRRLLDLARHGDDVHVPDRDRRVVEGRRSGAPLHGGVVVPRDRDHRRVPVAGPAAVLPVLRGSALPDVLHHRRVGLEASRLRRHEVPAVHDVRLGVPARGHPLPVRRRQGTSWGRPRSTSPCWSSCSCRPAPADGCSSPSSSASR